MNQSKKSITDKSIRLAFQGYMNQIRNDWKVAAPAILLPGIGSIFVFFVPTYVVAKLVGRIAEDPNISPSSFVSYIALVGGTWLLGEAIWRFAFHLEAKTCSRGITRLYNEALEKLLVKDIDFFNNNFAGSLTKNLNAYARNYERFYGTLAFEISPNLIPILFAAVVLSFYSPYLSLALLGMILLTFCISLPFIKKRRKLVAIREASSTQLSGHVADVIGNIQAVKSFATEANEHSKHRHNVWQFITKAKRSWDYQTHVVDMIISPLYVLTNVIGLSIVIFLSKNDSGLSAEAVLITFGYFANATRALFNFNQIYRNMETSLTEGAQFTEYLLDIPKINDPEDPQTLKNLTGAISFENVTFRYEDGEPSLFTDFSLSIPASQKLGLMGRSGGGKTSITKLLLRFVDIDEGAILIDGIDIRNITQKDLRSHIAYVPQDPAMFHRSIADNIRYSHPDAPIEDVIEAAKKAHAHEFIETLPNKYDTLVGERGIKLSGGQRQRVAIARAILKDAPILLLDEATSALDSESEQLIQSALHELMKGRTTIVIAHRLSTIQDMDRIVVLDKGNIVEEGSHTDLLNLDGIYAKLWAHQSGGFLED
jgi:ATP-binding cassette, subfamily B, bacterial